MSAYQSSFDFEWDEDEKEVKLFFRGAGGHSNFAWGITPAEGLDLREFLNEREDVLHEALEEALHDEQDDPDEVSE